MAGRTPIQIVPNWSLTEEGQPVPHRDAQHWRSAAQGAIHCDLCYRHCTIPRNESGWCQARTNQNGAMVIPDHGTIARFQRQRLGYKGGVRTFDPGAMALGVGGIRCTANCSFCCSSEIVWRPDRIDWFPKQFGINDDWYHSQKGRVHPAAVIARAQEIGATHITFAENEPLLTFEYTFDVARLAKKAGLKTVLYTNGFSTPQVIRQIAPFIDAVDLGIKGSLDPTFYAKHMRSPDAVPAVKAAALAWKQAGVYFLISDLVPTPHLLDDATFATASAAMYQWSATEIGPHTPILVGAMKTPATDRFVMMVRKADRPAYLDRIADALDAAHAAGLHYAHESAQYAPITCHACGGLLLEIRRGQCQSQPCKMFTDRCDCWSHEAHVTNGCCDHCGTAVPIQTQ